jgi:hypothetical protein
MGGVGSFMRQNRTLYVGRVHVSDDIEEIVARHFQEWGQVERTRVLTSRGVAFVTYSNEVSTIPELEIMSRLLTRSLGQCTIRKRSHGSSKYVSQ